MNQELYPTDSFSDNDKEQFGSWHEDGFTGDSGCGMSSFALRSSEAIYLALRDTDAVLAGSHPPPSCLISSPSRHIRGDPFANETPDLESWHEVFPSLCVFGHAIIRKNDKASANGKEADLSSFLSRPKIISSQSRSLESCFTLDELIVIGTQCKLLVMRDGYLGESQDGGEIEEVIACDGILEEWIEKDCSSKDLAEEDACNNIVINFTKEELKYNLFNEVWDTLAPSISSCIFPRNEAMSGSD